MMKRILLVALLLLPALVGCRDARKLPDGPRPRIVSFSPALTAILFEMGLKDHVVGVTGFCSLPEGESRPIVGDRQNINVERILSFDPDLIVIQQQISDFDVVARADPSIRIEHFTIENLDDIAFAIERLGSMSGAPQLGIEKRRQFEQALQDVREKTPPSRRRVVFLTSADPLAVAGRDSFIHQMITAAGGEDVTARYMRWTQINVERVITAAPDVLICLTEPGRADEVKRYLATFQGVPAVASGQVFVVTDRRWTIPSTYLAELTAELAGMIHAEGAE